MSAPEAEQIQFALASLHSRGWEEVNHGKRIEFKVWALDTETPEIIRFLSPLLSGKIREQKVKTEKWEKSWKAFFKPIQVGKRLLVLPSWMKPDKNEKRIKVRLNPGMAFGNGDHPTTQMCLLALEKNVQPGDRWLDLGTGSGILAIAATKLGAKEVLAMDEDPIALHYAKANREKNHLTGKIKLLERTRPPRARKFDGIVSNILAEPLVELAPSILSALKPGGVLILSGITREKAPWLIREYKRLKAVVLAFESRKEWVCLRLELHT